MRTIPKQAQPDSRHAFGPKRSAVRRNPSQIRSVLEPAYAQMRMNNGLVVVPCLHRGGCRQDLDQQRCLVSQIQFRDHPVALAPVSLPHASYCVPAPSNDHNYPS